MLQLSKKTLNKSTSNRQFDIYYDCHKESTNSKEYSDEEDKHLVTNFKLISLKRRCLKLTVKFFN